MKVSRDQIWYVFEELEKNKGGETEVLKEELIELAVKNNIEFRKNISKEKLVELLKEKQLGEEIVKLFGSRFTVPGWYIKREWDITYKQVKQLEEIGILTPAGIDKKDYTVYTLDCLAIDESEAMQKWADVFQSGTNRVRVEVRDQAELDVITQKLGASFEITDVAKLYKHRDGTGYYAYFNIRALDNKYAQENLDNKNIENVRLKTKLVEQEEEIKGLKEQIESLKRAQFVRESPQRLRAEKEAMEIAYRKEQEENKKLQEELMELKVIIFKNKVEKEKIHNARGAGRKAKFTEAEIECIKMYRLQGLKIAEIAKMYNCSTGLIHKLIHE